MIHPDIPSNAGNPPASDLDPFEDQVLLDPYPHYRRLRDMGPVVWMHRYGMWALTRYAAVRRALRDWEVFSSARGVGMTPECNEVPAGVLTSEPPEHSRLRRVLQGQLSGHSLRAVEPVLQSRADELVGGLVGRGTFDAVRDLAEPFVVAATADLVGLPAEGRSELLANSDAAFNRFGPANRRYVASEDRYRRLFDYVASVAVPGRLTPDGLGARLFEAADAGVLDYADCVGMMVVYTWPSLATTVSAIGNAMHQLALHPDQWGLVRDDPDLIPAAFLEALRIDSPGQIFTRAISEAVRIGDVHLATGARVMVLVGSANRDEHHYPDPDRFDIRRKPSDHLAFGHGMHHCAGATFATLEAHAVLRALASHAASLTVLESRQRLNNVIRGPARLLVGADRAASPRVTRK